MKKTAMMRLLLIGLVMSLYAVLIQPATASADDALVNKIAGVLDDMGPANPFQSQGVTGNALRGSKELFNCIDKGDDPVVCIKEAHDTDLGKLADNAAAKIAGGGLPSWFWDVIDLYVAFVHNDYWGIIYHLGKGAICLVAQVIAGSYDVCNLVEALVDTAKAVYDIASQVVDWIQDVVGIDITGAVWDAAESAYCSTIGSVFGGCDDEPPPPPPAHEVIFGKYFAPYIVNNKGLELKEAVGWKPYGDLIASLRDQAFNDKFKRDDVAIAGKRFDQEIVKQWSGHMLDQKNGVLAALQIERVKYVHDAQILNQHIQQLWNESVKQIASLNSGSERSMKLQDELVVKRCTAFFHNAKPSYEHVDRWVNHPPTKEIAAQVRADSNTDWCGQYLSANRDGIHKQLRQKMAGICQVSGNKFICNTPESFKTCFYMLRRWEPGTPCVATANVSNAAAAKLKGWMEMENKNKVTVTYTPSYKTGLPAVFVNNRPLAHEYCKQSALDVSMEMAPLLTWCSYQPDPAYVALVNQVARIVSYVNTTYKGEWLRIIPGGDPLYVEMLDKKEMPYAVAEFLKNYSGFKPPSTSKGFVYFNVVNLGPMGSTSFKANPLASLTTPTLGYSPSKQNWFTTADPAKYKMQPGNPVVNPDPTNKVNVFKNNSQVNTNILKSGAMGGVVSPAQKGKSPAAMQKQ